MSLAIVRSHAQLGLDAPEVTVEVHLANGLPSFTLVGLADVEVKEARERVRSALQNAGLEFPLSPKSLFENRSRYSINACAIREFFNHEASLQSLRRSTRW